MPRNYVEFHVVGGGTQTFKIKSGVTLKPRDVVYISGDGEVALSNGTQAPVGVVIAGTVSANLFNDANSDLPQLDGSKGHVASVVLKGMGSAVWQKANSAVTAGQFVKAHTDGRSVVPWVSGTDAEGLKLGIAQTGGSAGQDIVVLMI